MASDTMLSDDFKQAMRRLATTIALVTAGKGESWTGMAATAVTSVMSDPPTVLVAVNRTASISSLLFDEQCFCINLLAERHKDLVGIFSGQKKGMARFETGEWTSSPEGLPVLKDAVASLICTTQMTLGVGTHTLFIGQVQSIVNHPSIDPLIWVDGCFASAARI